MTETELQEELKLPEKGSKVIFFRGLVDSFLEREQYASALFWADKLVTLSTEMDDIYLLGRTLILSKHYHRAEHLITSRKLQSKHLGCCFLAVKAYQYLGNEAAALELLESPETEKMMEEETKLLNSEDYRRKSLLSSLYCLKGSILENIENRELAAQSFKNALHVDVYCYEALQALIEHQMLNAQEEKNLLNSLFSEENSEARLIKCLYSMNLKKYDCPETPVFPSELKMFENNSDVRVSMAERLYYNCEHIAAYNITSQVLRDEPLHTKCIPLHVALLVDMKKTNQLFRLAHSLVDQYPEWSVAWYAVGCYYYNVGKQDNARKYLSKATQLDRMFGPAWLAYGHSFALENEHDQAMAAYFKACQLMHGCHLPLLYIGLEYSLTNNQNLAEKFFNQALSIAPNDPFVLHELGVTAFTNQDYDTAEKYFTTALLKIKQVKDQNGVSTGLADKWESLLNNLGHTLRKQGRYEESLSYHQQALVLSPLNPSTYSAIGYVQTLIKDLTSAVESFHRALGLRKDDTFSTSMLNEVVERLMSEVDPFPDYPEDIPRFECRADYRVQTPLDTVETTRYL
ncbi:cell division cycle protein 16 homolog isoform X1 [Eurytemora carolleeae]|uniref:cell division cycle protein 16 homolog isoform X1 n=1 Tax=Eurytemora carolleeae TaxID=1294199 RepID=UPI000C758E8E|nr:cell division cycle protein 16 homolog isoform X1 [Eurytemora carolleeae]|eukprot:XP_023346984.1 cell division cycle protein 16 homolog isoform X1 [Eurytemora affinis]